MFKLDNSRVRRRDRLLDTARAADILREAEYGTLSMQLPEGGGYGVPVNFVWDGADAIYLHGAPSGRKVDCIDSCARVSFCAVGRTQLQAARLTTGYESVIADCRAARRLPEDEKLHAVRLLLEKYSPPDMDAAMAMALKSLPRTEIVRLDILSVSGKRKAFI